MLKEGFKEITSFQPESENDLNLELLEGEILEKTKEVEKKGDIIGEGETARVYVCESNPEVCYKFIKRGNASYRYRVDTKKEGLFLLETCDLDNDVEVPKPYYSIITKGEIEALIMKRLVDYISIDDLIRNKVKLPDNFDYEIFFDQLKKFFDKAHNNKKIFHRDAHRGNIMINLKTGKPGVIDFGASKKLYISSDNPYEQIDVNSDVFIYTKDEIRIREVVRDLKKYIYDNN
ncbi:protein kinase domain protein [bacterium BMS3Abin15]|nr:protein kinase domain protein [bacterium BMS3Abin15]HDZ85050.1 hypothetical protein [Candidatus Moranbacteria bacterium]